MDILRYSRRDNVYVHTSHTTLSVPGALMKRALPSYEDLADGMGEEGEIIEQVSFAEIASDSVNVSVSEDEEFGLKAVLPVGKFNEKFREGDTPASGEEYLCTVRSERMKMNRIINCEPEEVGNSVKLRELCKDEVLEIEVEEGWAQSYWKCYQESEIQFLRDIENSKIPDEPEFEHLVKLNPTELHKKFYENDPIEPNMKFLSHLRNDQELTEKLLNCHKIWLESSSAALQIETEEERSKVATWLQALLMCLDTRLTSPQISNLRQLTRSLRANHPEFREIVLVIAYKYGQHDLIKIINRRTQ